MQVPGQYFFALQVEFPELWPASSPQRDTGTEFEEPTFVMSVTWPVRLLESPGGHWEDHLTFIAPLSPHSLAFRNHMAIGDFERYQGRGGVNASTSLDRWSEMSTRVALLAHDGNNDSESDTTATTLAYIIDSMSPRSIVHLADGAVPEVCSFLFHFRTSGKSFLRMRSFILRR